MTFSSTSTAPLTPSPAPAIPRLALIAAGVTALLWGSAFVVIRAAGTDLSPGPMALARIAVAALVLTPLALRAGGLRRLPRRVLPLVAAYGVMWFAAYNVALNSAERSIDAGTAAMLVNVAPVLIALGAGVFLKEGFPAPVIVGCVVAFGGVVLMSIGMGATGGDAWGLTMALLAAVLYAASVLLQKLILRDVDGLRATWLGCLAGTIALLPFTPALVDQVPNASPAALLGTVYLGIFSTAIAFTTYAYAMRYVPAGQIGTVGYLATVITVLMSWVLLSEVPTLSTVVGGAICLAGVIITRRRG
ncbi:DMT family transporter [Micromonospora sp. NPDC003197]